jgi:hypothetical protein
MKNDWELPEAWAWTTLGEITDVKGGTCLPCVAQRRR